ncbi:LysR substrate-binding domain-containing protein [Naasia lichenicola]|uniref:LysR substrate-binding domain-containing protein n=1 Tax=Naasia lichenicola TaxID=2565933 RepID=UPI00130E204D|nr:LysR substrate-binding domain-containing protein [Naasia lichenicola]
MSLSFTLRQLEHFDAIASEGSLTAAAARCHLSAAALALSLSELERHLGQQLFVRRKGRGVTIAPAGARLLAQARQLLATADALAADASQDSAELMGRFAIGCFSTLSPFFLPGVMDGFRREHPGLDLEFVAEATAPELQDGLLQGRLDAAVMYGVDVSTQLEFDPLHEYRPYVIVSERHPLAGKGPIQLSELAGEPLIQLDLQPSQENTEYIFKSMGLPPAVRHSTTNYELARCLVGRGLGYSVLIQRPASQLTYDGHAVAIIELAGDVPSAVVGLARPHGAPRTAKYMTLREFLLGSSNPHGPGG